MVVVDVYQLGMFSGSYSKDHKKQTKNKAVMTRSYVEDMMTPIPYTDTNGDRKTNPAWTKTGKLFVIDEEATQEWQERFAAKQEKMKMADEIEAVKTSKILGKVIASSINNSKGDTIELPEGEPSDKWTKPQLQLYCDENDIEYKKTLGVKKLLEIINK